MISTSKRKIESGKRYEAYFPRAEGLNQIIKTDATLEDTMELIVKVVDQTLEDTKQISELLNRGSVKESSREIWNFVYSHIPYQRDKQGVEQVRRPSRAWQDRNQGGVDCDCYTVFISSILSNLKIAHKLRVTKYKGQDQFSHIYPVAIDENNQEIIIDCVTDAFNFEVPYTAKQDTIMELEYLHGFESKTSKSELNQDTVLDEKAKELFSNNEYISDKQWALSQLQKTVNGAKAPIDSFAREGNQNYRHGKNPQQGLKKFFKKVGTGIKKGFRFINRINPAAILLRQGFLVAMKLNLMKVAGKLRFAYMDANEAKQHGISFRNMAILRKALAKGEKIFVGAGGKAKNMKKAILTGKGNRDRKVALGGFSVDGLDYDEHSSMEEILGEEMYYDELPTEEETMGGVHGLNAIATGAAIAAATGFVAALAKALQQVQVIQKRNAEKQEVKLVEAEPDFTTENIYADESIVPIPQKNPSKGAEPEEEEPKEKKGMFDKMGDWVKGNPGTATVILTGIIGVGFYGFQKFKEKQEQKKIGKTKSLRGTPRKKKSSTSKSRSNDQFKVVELLG